jgi:hypothetical protein
MTGPVLVAVQQEGHHPPRSIGVPLRLGLGGPGTGERFPTISVAALDQGGEISVR